MRSEVTKEKDKARDKARKERLKAQGMCVRCGQRPVRPGRIDCEECAERIATARRKKNERETVRRRTLQAERKANGVCTRCGKQPAIKGLSVCAYCLEKRRGYDKKRKSQDEFYRREEIGEEYTPEEIADIVSGDNRMTSYKSAKYGVSYEQVLWMRREYRNGADLTGIRKHHRLVKGCDTSWTPLEEPEGDIDKLCGECEKFVSFELIPKHGIYGTCAADGKRHHRCDSCTAQEAYTSLGPQKCVRLNDQIKTGEQLGIWAKNYYVPGKGSANGR